MEETPIRLPGATRNATVFVASDATGLTAERVVKAALVQFEPHVSSIVRFSRVLTVEDVHEVVVRAARERGIIVHTLVVTELREAMIEECRHYQVDAIDLMGPLLQRLSTQLHESPHAQAGLFRQIDEEYFRRIEAVDFTVKHDDGMNPQDLPIAEIVIVGLSRTCKTPLSIYLSYHGWRVANVPIVEGMEPPPQLAEVEPGRIVALSMEPDHLVKVRAARMRRVNGIPSTYGQHERVLTEVREARRLYARKRWPVVDVTNKSVEEISTEVIALVRRTRQKKQATSES